MPVMPRTPRCAASATPLPGEILTTPAPSETAWSCTPNAPWTRSPSAKPSLRDATTRPSASARIASPVEIGEAMRALALGRVVASRNEGFAEGDLVQGAFGVQDHAVSEGAGVVKISPGNGVALAAHLGVLGMTGMTAYFGLLDVGRLEDGDTVLVSGAAGAVGTTVGQIAKVKGARVVGVAGGARKCAMLVDELGFDAAVDYKAGGVGDQLREQTPDGVNVFFDNVGGDILDHGLTRLARHARVVICGAISQYNATARGRGP